MSPKRGQGKRLLNAMIMELEEGENPKGRRQNMVSVSCFWKLHTKWVLTVSVQAEIDSSCTKLGANESPHQGSGKPYQGV